MLVRKIEKNIANWIKNGEKTLIVQGGRQVGKTYTIRKCLKRSNFKYVEFNFIDDFRLSKIVDNFADMDDLILKLSLLSGRKIVPGETIIFLDEIQHSNLTVEKIKAFTDDSRYRFILSGALLEIKFEKLETSLASAFQIIRIYPLDFEEFTQVFHISEDVLNLVKNAFKEKKPVDSFIHQRMMEIFNLYLVIGGMPGVVETYRNFEDINQVIEEHKSIVEQNKRDFSRYWKINSMDGKIKPSMVYDMIPYQLCKKNKRFKISDINVNLRYARIKDYFLLLWKSGATFPVFNANKIVNKLEFHKKETLFKLFYNDVGILSSICGKDAKLSALNNEKDVCNGAIHENAVAQELLSHGFTTFYYSNKSKGEIDFIVENGRKIIPIDVRIGKNYPRHSAIFSFSRSQDENLEKPIVFTRENVFEENSITFFPIYMIMFLEKAKLDFADISVEKFRM